MNFIRCVLYLIVAFAPCSVAFAGSLKIELPADSTLSDSMPEHRFFKNFITTLQTGLANTPKNGLKGDWKLQLEFLHGFTEMVLDGSASEQVRIKLSATSGKTLEAMIPYPLVRKEDPAKLANTWARILWKYMTTGKLETIPYLPAPKIA